MGRRMQRNRVLQQTSLGVTLLILPLAMACSSDAAAPEHAERGSVVSPFAAGLSQRVSVRYPEQPSSHREFIIESRLFNDGTALVPVRYRVCFLHDEDLRTTMRHTPSALPGCLAVEVRQILAPGDSSDGVFYWGHALSGPGTYDVQVRQSLDPEHWTTIQVRVE